MTSILPKGIVVNTREISGDIERIDREPLAVEEIAKLWKVYTTTKRRLLDPTAERLENYWWRLWGSRKRNLNGATVARLFADISDGASFVQLRGPLNRHESGGRPVTPPKRAPRTANATAIRFDPESQSSNSALYLSSSKTHIALPPPILKKSRGSSSSGPRPTARFISPRSSEDEDDGENSSTTSPGAQVIIRPPTPDAQTSKGGQRAEVSPGVRRKPHPFAATNAGHKRRPGVARRPNSDPATKAHEAPRVSAANREPFGSLPEHIDHPKELGKLLSGPQDEDTSPPSSRQDGKTLKKARSTKNGHAKIPAGPGLTAKDSLNGVSTPSLNVSVSSESAGRAGNTGRSDSQQGALSKENRMREEMFEALGSQDGVLVRARLDLEEVGKDSMVSQPVISKKRTPISPRESRSGLEGDVALNQKPEGEQSASKGLNFKGSITLAPTYTAAAGQLDFRDETSSMTKDDLRDALGSRGLETVSVMSEQNSIFAKRPVQPTKSASALFALSPLPSNDSISRSKSQLTLLLEKDRAKTSEQKRKV